MSDDEKDVPADFELRKYELDRAHELELNKFAHGLEVERLKVLQLVNGGAFTVLVAFAPGLLRVGGAAGELALAAAVCWVAGLGIAAAATQVQIRAQVRFNQGVRYRRHAIEWHRLDKRDGEVAGRVGPPPPGKTPTSANCYEGYADEAYRKGGRLSNWMLLCAAAGVALFIAGALLLTCSLSQAGPAAVAPAEKASA